MGRSTRTGARMSVLPSTIHGKKLGAQEWRDYLFLHYGINPPPHLPDHCNGYGAAFEICHAIDCKKVGLIPENHNDLRDRVSNLASKAFTPTHVLGNPKIYTDRDVSGGNDNLKGSPYKDKGGLKGGLLIRDLWVQGTNSIHGTNVMNTDTTSY